MIHFITQKSFIKLVIQKLRMIQYAVLLCNLYKTSYLSINIIQKSMQKFQSGIRNHLSSSSANISYLNSFSGRSTGYNYCEVSSQKLSSDRYADLLNYLTDFFIELVQALQSMKTEMYKMIGIQTVPQMNLLLTSKQIYPDMISIIDTSKSCLHDLKRIEALMKGYVIGRQSSASNRNNQDLSDKNSQNFQTDLKPDPYTFCKERKSQIDEYDRESVQIGNKTDYHLQSSKIVKSRLETILNAEIRQQLTVQDQRIAQQNQLLKKELQELTKALNNKLMDSKRTFVKQRQKQKTQYESLALIKLLKQQIAKNNNQELVNQDTQIQLTAKPGQKIQSV